MTQTVPSNLQQNILITDYKFTLSTCLPQNPSALQCAHGSAL